MDTVFFLAQRIEKRFLCDCPFGMLSPTSASRAIDQALPRTAIQPLFASRHYCSGDPAANPICVPMVGFSRARQVWGGNRCRCDHPLATSCRFASCLVAMMPRRRISAQSISPRGNPKPGGSRPISSLEGLGSNPTSLMPPPRAQPIFQHLIKPGGYALV